MIEHCATVSVSIIPGVIYDGVFHAADAGPDYITVREFSDSPARALAAARTVAKIRAAQTAGYIAIVYGAAHISMLWGTGSEPNGGGESWTMTCTIHTLPPPTT